MDQMFTNDNIMALRSLLRDPDEDAEDSDREDKPPMARIKPSDIGPKAKKKVNPKGDQKEVKPTRDPNAIWDAEEVPEGSVAYEEIDDPRPQPEYELFYKQAVTTEDIYLQMGIKNPTTACCESLVARVKLPGCHRKDVILDVKDKFLDLRTPKYKLGLHLPNPVDPETSKAEWDEDKETLSVTMRNKRELDFMQE